MKPKKFIVIDFLVVLKVATRVLPGIVRIKNASVSRFFLTSLKAWFQTLMEFNTLNIYFSIYLFFSVCMQGYSGPSPCPYPTYGNDCQMLCNYSKDMCDASTGCQNSTTGMFSLFYKQENYSIMHKTLFINTCITQNVLYLFKLK